MNSDDLWIGDRVQLIKSGRIGTYEGKHPKGKAKISVGNKIILSSFQNLKIVEEEKSANAKLELIETRPRRQVIEKSIDLHIEKLFPHLENELPQLILQKQITSCRNYIQQAIDHRLLTVQIVHGIGKGQLKSEIHHLLKDFPEVQTIIETNNGGASEIWFKYRLK